MACTSTSSQKRTVTLTFLAQELLFDIRHFAFAEGDVMGDDAQHQKHLTQDIGEAGNLDITTRSMDTAFEVCVQVLYPYARVAVEDGETRDDRLTKHDYVLELTVPPCYSQTTLNLFEHLIHDYVVYWSLFRWLMVTSPTTADKYLTLAEDVKEQLKQAKFSNYTALKRPLYPVW